MLNVAGLEPAPPGNRLGALTTEPYVQFVHKPLFIYLVNKVIGSSIAT